MKSYAVFILLPLLMSSNLASAASGTGRVKSGQPSTSNNRSPASSTSSNNSTQGVQQQPLTYEECLGIAGEEYCQRNRGEVDDLALRKMPKDEFMKYCSENAPSGTNCKEEYNERHREMIKENDSENAGGDLAKCRESGGVMQESGCVIDDGKKADSAKSAQDAADAKSAACLDAFAETQDSCNAESKSMMGNMSEIMNTLGPAINQINPNTCGGIAAAQTGSAAALASFQMMCNSAMKKCTESCTGSTVPSDVANLAECKKIGVKAADANKSAAAAMMTLKSSVTQCQNAFGDLNQQATAYCASNPASCAIKPMIGAQSIGPQGDQAGGAPAPNLGTEGVGGLTGKGAGGLNIGDLGDDSGGGIGTINPSKPGEDPGGGKGGGHLGSSGGGQGDASGGRGGGGKKEGMFSNILSGFFGGGSGGGSGGGFFSKLFGGGNKSDAYAANNPNVKKVGPDLRQFLPGGLHDPNRNRGIAGQFVGKDGMAGPYSDIWKNINNRYQFKRASLVP